MRLAPRLRGWILAALVCAFTLAAHPATPADASPATRVEVTTADSTAALRLLQRLGATVEVRSADRIQATLPLVAWPALARAHDVVRIEPPAVAVPLQIASPTSLIGADRWQDGGYSGHGVKVAIVDTGFTGYEGVLGSTLPAAVVARSFRADGSMAGTGEHGRRAAEVVSRIAPGATIYLVAFSTVTELSAAVDYLIAEDVDVVSFSLGYIHNGPGDGTGSVDRIVTRATDAGLAWTVAAGNWAQQHWAGMFRDDNRDAVHEFRAGTQQVTHAFTSGDLITLSLRWDDAWGASCADYDLELFGPEGALVRAARGTQNCSGDPVESLQVLATMTGDYAARVVRANNAQPKRLDLIFVGSPDRGASISIPVPAGSLSSPADHPGVVTVGALTVALVRAEAPYSSRGPTVDGRAKPNILAPTVNAPGVTIEEFAGTSAAAPHVAGVMALLKEALGFGGARLGVEVQARGVIVPAVQDGTANVRRLDLGSAVGPLLPAGSAGAKVEGTLPRGAGIATLTYRGPAGYPLRFAYRLLNGRDLSAAWVWDSDAKRWRAFIVGAPAIANDIDALADGTVFLAVLRP